MQAIGSGTWGGAVSQPQVDQMLEQAKATLGSGKEGKVEKSAKEFESILLAQWLQQAEQSFASVPGGNDEQQDPGYDQLQGIAMQSLAKSLTDSGGIGLAKMVSQGLYKAASNRGEDTKDEPGGAPPAR